MKNYDALLLPTGETTKAREEAFQRGEEYSPVYDVEHFPVSSEAVRLFKEGNIGHIFVTGGYSGFSPNAPGTIISEAEETARFLSENGIYDVYSDSRSLDTMGNFTFPTADPLPRNPNLKDFGSILVLGKEGHMKRVPSYAQFCLAEGQYDIATIPGKHTDGFLARVYHWSFVHAMRNLPQSNPEEAHKFLTENHPFYSEGWYEKGPTKRKLEAIVTVLGWYVTDPAKKQLAQKI